MLGIIFTVLFGLSLLPGRKPLCLVFAAKISDGIMPDGAETFCRRLTWGWFLLLLSVSVLSFFIPFGHFIALPVVPIALVLQKLYIDRRFRVIFHTSGSTGKSKTIIKSFAGLAKEIAFHRRWYRNRFPSEVVPSDVLFLGTIQWDHMYGTLWMKMLPKAMGARVCERIIASPEELIAAMKSSKYVFLVTTPSFLEHFVKYAAEYELPRNVIEIVTSGSRLRRETAKRAETVFGVCPRQIYGSTETGGIGSCREKDTIEVFEEVRVSVREGRLLVKSPYSFKRNYLMGDGVELAGDGRSFKLLGRVDRLVKISEERVNLAEMEDKVRALGFADAALVTLQGEHGPYLGLVVVEGPESPLKSGASSIKMRQLLLPVFPRGTVPKKYRFVEAIPKNPQGKVVFSEIAQMF